MCENTLLLENAANESAAGALDRGSDAAQGVLLCLAQLAAVSTECIQGMNLPFAW